MALLICWMVTDLVANEPVHSLVGLREVVAANRQDEINFRLEGTVCAVHEGSRLMVLQDATGAVILEMAKIPAGLSSGMAVVVSGERCRVSRGGNAIRLGTESVIEFDGHHPAMERSGAIRLREGMQPLRVEWFNGYRDVVLKLEYEGPGVARQEVPQSAFFHRSEDGKELKPGLAYQSYEGAHWSVLPDFHKLTPAKTGIVPGLDLGVRSRPEYSGMVFSGFMKVPADGIYRFHLTSDDGARLYVGDPSVTCEVVSGQSGGRKPEVSAWGGDVSGVANRWVEAMGTVNFAYLRDGILELDVSDENSSFQVSVADGQATDPSIFLQKVVKVHGVALRDGIVVVDRRQVEIMGNAPGNDGALTRIIQIRRMRPESAAHPSLARVRGVVTMTGARSMVIQDFTGGVYIHYSPDSWPELPKPGEIWEVEGPTDPGGFSPVIFADKGHYIGRGPFPPAVKPTSEQLVSGSLDAERIEIEGVVTAVNPSEILLLTREGNVRIQDKMYYPLPTRGMTPEFLGKLPGSVVRIRGVLAPIFHSSTRRVDPESILLGNSSITVDESVPADPFAIPKVSASDLFLFTSHPTAFKRVKVSGVVLHSRPPEYFLADGKKGFRIVSRDAIDLIPGDEVDAVGFPRLGGSSPALLEVQVRKKGRLPIPAPLDVSAEELAASRLDSTLVTVRATVLSDTVQRAERVIELKAGKTQFLARLSPVIGEAKPMVRGSVVQVSGVYAIVPGDDFVMAARPFDLLLNSSADVRILKRGPWWTTRHTMAVIAMLSSGLLLALVWGTMLRRVVAQRGRQLALELEERQAIERHRAMEQERVRMAQDLHDELGSGLTEAGILSSLVKNPQIPDEKKDAYLDQLSEVCRSLVTGLDEIVWAVNPRYDSVPDLAGYYSLFAQGYLQLAGITCLQNIDESIPGLPLDSNIRHGIFMAFKEGLNNIVRHSRAEEVALVIGVDGGILSVSLSDDGCGFDTASTAPGRDGLNGMKQRMEKLGGDCTVTSKVGVGTTVVLTLPLERSAS